MTKDSHHSTARPFQLLAVTVWGEFQTAKPHKWYWMLRPRACVLSDVLELSHMTSFYAAI